MTEGHQPYPMTDAETELLPAGTLGARPAGDYPAGGDQSTVEVAKEQAAGVAQTGVQTGQHVASVAKDQAAQVTAEAGRQAKDLLDQARSELSQQATTQQQRLADNLKSLSQQLHSMARNSDQPGLATDLARQGGEVTDQVASWFDGREPAAVLQDVRRFARRRPGTFLLMAAGAGLLAGRLTRGLKDQASDDSGAGSGPSGLTTGGAPVGYPAAGGLTTGGYAGSAEYPAGGGYPAGEYPAGGGYPAGEYPADGGYAGSRYPAGEYPTGGGIPPSGTVPPTGGYGRGLPPTGSHATDDLIPFTGQEGDLDYPGEPR